MHITLPQVFDRDLPRDLIFSESAIARGGFERDEIDATWLLHIAVLVQWLGRDAAFPRIRSVHLLFYLDGFFYMCRGVDGSGLAQRLLFLEMVEIGLVIPAQNTRLVNYLDFRRLLPFRLCNNIHFAKLLEPGPSRLPPILTLNYVFHAARAI